MCGPARNTASTSFVNASSWRWNVRSLPRRFGCTSFTGFPANLLEKLFREMYVRRMDLSNIEARIVRDVDPERFRKITSSTLEGLAKRELNLGALLGKSAEARERRLIPEVIEDPQVKHLETFRTLRHPTQGEVVTIRRPVRIDGGRDGTDLPAPALGQHTEELLSELGYDAVAIGELRAASVI